MPYQRKVQREEVQYGYRNTYTPLKMFDAYDKNDNNCFQYEVYKHILKNNFNCILVDINEDEKWSKTIKLAFKKITKK